MERSGDFVILHKLEMPEKGGKSGIPLATLTKNMKKCIKNPADFEKKYQCPLEKWTNSLYDCNKALCKKYCDNFWGRAYLCPAVCFKV